ncbi:hypothetical protein [Streptomyces sp. NPDC058373]|uniref:hypothetical protein n=1 Tax=Streptomyces sp. NPDC058373 TaxID=3346465 RepID=UPI00365E49A9
MVLALTATVDIPLNNELAALGPTEGVRDFSLLAEFTGTWETADIARTVLCCSGSSSAAGRSSSTGGTRRRPTAPPWIYGRRERN